MRISFFPVRLGKNSTILHKLRFCLGSNQLQPEKMDIDYFSSNCTSLQICNVEGKTLLNQLGRKFVKSDIATYNLNKSSLMQDKKVLQMYNAACL